VQTRTDEGDDELGEAQLQALGEIGDGTTLGRGLRQQEHELKLGPSGGGRPWRTETTAISPASKEKATRASKSRNRRRGSPRRGRACARSRRERPTVTFLEVMARDGIFGDGRS
jgi:hypothetical protein